jgi:threonine/homoserine/homoserine lactone efflux protein
MPSVETLLTFTVAALILNLSPGPSNLYVMARSIGQGVRGGVVAAIGLATGVVVHVLVAALGLSAIFTYSPAIYTLVKILGAVYLIFLGIQYWKGGAGSVGAQKVAKTKSEIQIFKESVLVEVTNPKTALFFLAFLPQFVVPETGSIVLQNLIFGAIVTVSALPCDIFIAISAHRIALWLAGNKKKTHIQERVSGSILLGMGSYILADEIWDCQAR